MSLKSIKNDEYFLRAATRWNLKYVFKNTEKENGTWKRYF